MATDLAKTWENTPELRRLASKHLLVDDSMFSFLQYNSIPSIYSIYPSGPALTGQGSENRWFHMQRHRGDKCWSPCACHPGGGISRGSPHFRGSYTKLLRFVQYCHFRFHDCMFDVLKFFWNITESGGNPVLLYILKYNLLRSNHVV